MGIDYKKELEAAAKGMILVHDPNTLIKMIARTIVQKAKVSHAGILLHHKDTDSYILTVSQGPAGLRIPAGFARIDKNNPLIRIFCEQRYKDIFNGGAFVYGEAGKILREKVDSGLQQLLEQAFHEMEIFDVVACIPSYFRDDLLGLLLLGEKKNAQGFARVELDFFMALASDVAMAIRNAQLFKELESELARRQRLFIDTSFALAAAIDAKDKYTHGHTKRVTSFCLEIAQKLSLTNKKLFDAKFFENLHIAGLLHDIGKIGVPESILNKEDSLDSEEWRKMKEHTIVGATILQPIKELAQVIPGVKYHHEKYDGSGYPQGLKGEQIPLIASIISVADAFDAMITDRPYRNSLSKKEAIEEIKRLSGKQFKPEIAFALIELYRENKI